MEAVNWYSSWKAARVGNSYERGRGHGEFLSVLVANIWVCRDVAKEEAERVRAPLGAFGPPGSKVHESQNSGGSNRTPHRSHEICPETDKEARQGSRGPSDHLARQKNRAPVTLRAPVTTDVIISDPSEYQGPPTVKGPMNIRGLMNIRDPLFIRGPPNCQGPLIIRGPSEHQGPSD